MDTEGLVQRATTDLSRARRVEATLQIARTLPHRKAAALIVRIFAAHAHAPWKRELTEEAEPIVRALEGERATKLLRALVGKVATAAICEALIRLGDNAATPALVDALDSGQDYEAVVRALSILGDARAVIPLRQRGAREAVAAIQARIGEDARGGELSRPDDDT